MHPFLFILLALFTPFVLALTLLAPPLAGMIGAAYIVYDTGATHPLAGHLLDVFYMIDFYSKLFNYWYANYATLSFVQYTLPVVVLPLSCALFALWLTRRLVRKLADLFHLGVAH